ESKVKKCPAVIKYYTNEVTKHESVSCTTISALQRVRQLSRDNRIKKRRAWLLLGWSAYPAIGGGSEITFQPFVPRLSVIEGFLALTSPERFGSLKWQYRGVSYLIFACREYNSAAISDCITLVNRLVYDSKRSRASAADSVLI
ncbi:hypothetical protein J6590_098757, partial [Homalodisca vitripennis]